MHADGDPRHDDEALFPGSFVDQAQFDRARKQLETYLFMFKEQPLVQTAHRLWAIRRNTLQTTDEQGALDAIWDVLNQPPQPLRLRKGRRVLAVGRRRWDNLSPPSAS
jgi:hypothetical protein